MSTSCVVGDSNMSERFVSEAIQPLTATFDTARMATGEPGLPRAFVWRGRTIEVSAVLRSWRETALAERFCAWAAHTAEGRRRHRSGVLFKPPQKVEPLALVPVETDRSAGYAVHTLHHVRRREGFALTDPGTTLVGGLGEANYCIICHEQGKDSCSKGLKEKADESGKAAFKKSPFGVPLPGCPLEERISEFHKLKTEGVAIAALAMITVDNAIVCATGHRICNDCMKSCIYQRQDSRGAATPL